MVEWHHRRITAELMSGDIGMNVKIAFIQLLPEHSLDKNLEIGKNACIEAKEMGADIALFPEMWSDGYYLPQDVEEWSPSVSFLESLLFSVNDDDSRN